MAQDKVRVYVLARELNMESKDLLDLCQQANIDVKNQLSSLDPEQRDHVVELVRRGGTVKPQPAAPTKPVTSGPIPVPPPPLRNLDRRPPPPTPAPRVHEPPPVPPVPTAAPRIEPKPVVIAPPIPAPRTDAPRPEVKPVVEPVATTVEPDPVAPTPPVPAAPTVAAVAPPVEPIAPPAPAEPATPIAIETPAPVPVTPVPPPTPATTAKEEPAIPPIQAPVVKQPEPVIPAPPVLTTPAAVREPEKPAASTPPPVAPPRPAEPTPTNTTPPSAPPRPVGNVPTLPPRPLNTGSVRNLGSGGGGGAGGGTSAPRSDAGGNTARPADKKSTGPTHRIVSRPGGSGPRPTVTPPPAQRPATQQQGGIKPVKPGEEKKTPPPQTGPRKLADIPPELMGGDKPIRIEDLLKPPARAPQQPNSTTVGPVLPAVPEEELLEDEEFRKGGKKRPGVVHGREQRHAQRNQRAKEREKPVRGIELLETEDGQRRTGSGIKRNRKQIPQRTQPRKGKVPLELPITVRSLSEAMGLRAGELLMLLMGHGAPATININSVLDPDLAEALALEKNVELDIKRPLDAEEELLAEMEVEDNPEDLVARAPVVTIMGHVDHGKTSLLDRIRQSNVVATEAGGITQSLRAWRVEKDGRAITFLDTPGHEAFTKMRARGANVTDIAVIVVAADDGVMPQTEEAISHAKAAEVAIVVAINKIDLPNANLRKAEQQLYGLGLIPDNMGGDVPFVYTSASKGTGIADLLENILLVADAQLELKANPQRPGQGTCLEATVNEGQGVTATVLVQDGTFRRGDVIVCGPSCGRIRAMFDSLGRPMEEAGPSFPVRILGLDEIPNADDPIMVVAGEDALTRASEIAEKRQDKLRDEAMSPRTPVSLESLSAAKVAELKVILKADVRGSVEAIRKELEKLHHAEVRVRVLHTGLGGISESDVDLALTSPSDTIIVGFNVVPDDRARSLAEERGVQIREYDIIYKLTDDIRAALEGKLKPREEVQHLGRAVVRETFKISRVGTIAGCYVTQGSIERSALVRVIRNGVVVYPPSDRTVGLDSLKRFKEDAREVQQGYECGLKISGYDDIKVDDVIECYRIQRVQRTLS